MTMTVDVPSLADELAGSLPAFDARQQRIMLTLYRLFAEGAPVAPERLAEQAGLPLDAVVSTLDGFPNLERDDRGHVLGAGLTLEPTQHAVELKGVTLYAWCALDTLLLPLALGVAHVTSTPPSGSDAVQLTVDSAGARDITPPEAVLTLVRPRESLADDVRGHFCCFVHFFPSEEAARPWLERVEGTFAISIQDGVELGRLLAARMFGTVLRDGA